MKTNSGKKQFKNIFWLVLFFGAFSFFFFADATHAATYWVATTGSDSNPGTESEPFLTIQHGVDAAVAGDTVTVKDGTYNDNDITNGDGYRYVFYVDHSGAEGSLLTIQAQNPGMAVLDGRGLSDFGIGFFEGVHHVKIEGFEIKDCDVDGITGRNYAVPGDEISDIIISRNYIHNIGARELNPDPLSRTGLRTSTRSYNFLVDSNKFVSIGRTDLAGSSLDHAVYLFGHDHDVTNNIFYNDSSGWMVDISDEGDTTGSKNIQVSNNTFSGAACGDDSDGQIMIEGRTNGQVENIIISNNISYGSITSLVYWFSNSYTITSAYIRNNTSTELDIDTNEPSGVTYSSNALNTNPLFVDSGNNDYHLTASSPAIGHSLASDAPDHDYDQVARPQDTDDDGAYEYVLDASAPTFTVNDGTDAGPLKNDTINVTVTDASTITASEYGYSSDATCNASDTYGNAFTTDVNFTISGDHTDYLCVMATDEYSNTGYQLVGQLNTDNTDPILSFTDDVAAGPVQSDTIAATWGDSNVKKWEYDADGVCSMVPGDYSKVDTDGMNQIAETNNGMYICVYGEDAVGNAATLTSANDINIDITAPVVEITAPLSGTVAGTDGMTFTDDDPNDPECSPNNTDWTNCTSVVTTFADLTGWSGIAGGATFTLYLRDTDAAGNTGTHSVAGLIKEGEGDPPTFTVNDGTDAGPVQDDTINVTVSDASTITASEYGYSFDATCNASDTYGNAFTTNVNFTISGDHTDYLCVMATDEYSNTGYETVGQLNTDNTGPTLSFSDDVEAGPVQSDTIAATWGDASVNKWEYDTDGVCSTVAGDYSKTDVDSMDQTTQANNTKYICVYGEDAVGNAATLTSANDINIDVLAPTGGSFVINNGDATTATVNVTLNVTCPSDSWTPIEMAYGNTASPTNWTACAASQTHTLSAGDGTKTVYMRFRDAGTNTTSDVTDTIELVSGETDVPTFTVNDGTDAGPVQDDTINVTVSDASTITASEYGYSSDATCNTSDTYGNAFTTDVNFTISGDHTDYLCVMATDEYSNTGYETVGQLNTDNTGPVASEVTPVTTPTADTTPDYTFTTNEAGTITYGGDCSSTDTSATVGSNTVTFNALAAGAHSNCTITVTDATSNVSNTVSVTSFTIDNAAPTGGSFVINNGDATTATVNVTLNVTCPSDSWTPIEMAYGNTASPTNWTACAASQTHTLSAGDGTKTVYMRFRDAGTNTTSDVTDTITLATSVPDTTAPVSVADPSGGTYNTAQSVVLTCEDEVGGSGCSAIYYTTNGTEPTSGSSQYTSPITISASATLKFFAEDVDGNSETINTETYVIDAAAEAFNATRPDVTLGDEKYDIKPKKTYWSPTHTFVFKGEVVGIDGGTVKIYDEDDLLRTATIENGEWREEFRVEDEGLYKISFRYYSSGGVLMQENGEYKIRVDTTDPRFKDLPKLLRKRAGQKIWWDGKDDEEVDHYKYNLDGRVRNTEREYFFLPSTIRRGYHSLRVKVYDEAGNSKSRRVRLIIW